MNKVFPSTHEAIVDVFDGAVVGVSGFFVAGVPLGLVKALTEKGTKNLTIACGCGPLLGFSEYLDALVANGQIKKLIESYPFYRSASQGRDSLLERAVRAGEIAVDVYPMGTLAEKYRCGGAGIPAFYTPTGVGTYAAEGREVRKFGDVTAVLETALRPDFSFIHAYRADTEGNVQYRKTARNFNPELAVAGKVTIVEAEEIVEVGELDPDKIHTPGVYVQRVVQVDRPKVRISLG